MKRLIVFGVLLALLFAFPGAARCEAPEPAGVDIWVEIKNGGTAVIAADENAPLPDKTSLPLKYGQSEKFHIVFTEVGVFSYTVRVQPGEKDVIVDDTVYRIDVYVVEENGKLSASIVIYDIKSNEKYARWDPEDGRLCGVAFENKVKPTPGGGSNSDQPKTGDDSGLERYLLTAIFSSAGLFALSVLYYISVKREKERKRLP